MSMLSLSEIKPQFTCGQYQNIQNVHVLAPSVNTQVLHEVTVVIYKLKLFPTCQSATISLNIDSIYYDNSCVSLNALTRLYCIYLSHSFIIQLQSRNIDPTPITYIAQTNFSLPSRQPSGIVFASSAGGPGSQSRTASYQRRYKIGTSSLVQH